MATLESRHLFTALQTAQSINFADQCEQLSAFIAETGEKCAEMRPSESVTLKTAFLIAQSLLAWHGDRIAGAPCGDGPNKSNYRSIVYEGGDVLKFQRYYVDFHFKPENFNDEMCTQLNEMLSPLGISVNSLKATPQYAYDGPPEHKRMGRPATTTYCYITAELSI